MSSIKVLEKRKNIALVAHDFRKADMLAWAQERKSQLEAHTLYATGTTGRIIEEETGLAVTKFFSGPLGGDQQIGSLIAEGKIDMLVFFWDPMNAQPHDTDVKALLRLSVTWNILLACDRSTADFLISSPYMDEAYPRVLPDYTDYLTRDVTENPL
ncbi:MAG: methylglyoxal synthase [Edaphocola sp.]